MLCMRDKAKWVGRMSGDAEAFPECEVINSCHPITPLSRCAAQAIVDPELVGLPGNENA